ncbi:ABC transporter permease [Aquibaculum sediminis]|uniref:ABC transporter permease n=1 Tax=Aquibaculum sediminis TaxID=3231907 RepID=UPI0034526439
MILSLVAKRLALGILTLWLVSLLIFAITEILPGDVATAILGQAATPETVAAIRNQLGLNEPAWWRYVQWLTGAIQGDFGISLANQRPVAPQILGRLENTLFLASVAAAIAVPLAISLGLIAAIKQNSLLDRTISLTTLASISVPEFFIAYLLIFFLAVQAGWFPSMARFDSDMGLLDQLGVIVLPALTLVLVVLAHMMRMTRATVLNVMAQPFVEMAELKGVPKWRIVVQHALPNALAPIINVVALNLAYLVVGVIVVEVVFVYPGLGQFMVDAVARRDIPTVQACGLIFAAVYVTLNMLADIGAILANPRLRHPR